MMHDMMGGMGGMMWGMGLVGLATPTRRRRTHQPRRITTTRTPTRTALS